MLRQSLIALGILVATTTGAFAQDARTVVAAASKVMGVDGLNSVTMNGAASNSNLGQMPNPAGPYVRNNASDYTRTLDFSQPALRASGVTFGIPIGGAVAVQGAFNQFITPMTPGGWAQQLNIWTTPWGFLKGAAANTPTVKVQTVGGKRYNVVTWSPAAKSPSGKAYQVVGYINDQNLVEKVETSVEHIMLGDLLVETVYGDYRDNNGLKFPQTILQRQGGEQTFEATLSWAVANPPNLAQLMTPPAGRGGGLPRGPDRGRARAQARALRRPARPRRGARPGGAEGPRQPALRARRRA